MIELRETWNSLNRGHIIRDQKLYSDGTPLIKTGDISGCDTMIVKPSSMMEFVNAMFLADSIKAQGGWVDHLVLPYVPGARQDRVNPTGDILDTAKSVAAMINQREFDKVSILDPHSPVITEAINNVCVFPLENVYSKLWQGYTGVIAPDKGGVDRATTAALTLRKPLVFARKTRDVSTGRLSGFEVESLTEGGHYLVVDDICDGGGTFLGLGEKILEQGAYADLYVTHGIFSKGTDELNKIYKNVITTDSRVVHERNRVLFVNIVERMIENV